MTIREARARLNALVEAVERGEQVVLMRGAKHVAAIVPLSADDLEVSPRITDAQAERLWRRIAAARRDGSSVVRENPEAAVELLARSGLRRGRSRTRSAGKRSSRRR